MRYQQKQSNQAPRGRYQQKEGPKTKFNFVYDQNKITYRSQIDQLPQKIKHKPDQKVHTKKTSEIEAKIQQLKKQRKAKKQEYKNGTQGFRKQIEQEKRKIELGKRCITVLNFDRDQIQEQISQVQDKLENHQIKIHFSQKPVQKQGKNKKLQEMNYIQLVKQENRIQSHMSSATLSKAEEVQLSNKLNKLKKKKLQVPKMVEDNKEDLQKLKQIESHKNSIQKLRTVKDRMNQNLQKIKMKIQSICQSIQQFQDKIRELHQKESTNDNNTLMQQAEQIKQKIYTLRNELMTIQQEYQTKKYDYQYQQQKINWIKWANDIKQKRKQEWEQEKLQRKRQKQRQKKYGPKPQKKQTNQKETNKQKGQVEDRKPQYQRKKFNKNQKQIDVCSFLIQYCKDLNSTDESANQANKNQQKKNIEEVLKKGEWAKMKGVEVIQSKKAKLDQEKQEKIKKKPKELPQKPAQTDKFSHTYFVAQTFDSVKVLPPSKKQQLQKCINQLQDKLEYYLAHPDEGVERNAEQNKKQGEKYLTSDKDKYSKVKHNKRVINNEQFPSLP